MRAANRSPGNTAGACRWSSATNARGWAQRGTPPWRIAGDIRRFMAQWNEGLAHGDTHPGSLAAFVHGYLATVHPWLDGNERTTRLAVAVTYLRHGWPPPVIRTARKQEYFETLQAGRGSRGSQVPLRDFLAEEWRVDTRTLLDQAGTLARAPHPKTGFRTDGGSGSWTRRCEHTARGPRVPPTGARRTSKAPGQSDETTLTAARTRTAHGTAPAVLILARAKANQDPHPGRARSLANHEPERLSGQPQAPSQRQPGWTQRQGLPRPRGDRPTPNRS